MLDSGTIIIYETENAAERGQHPLPRLVKKAEVCYENRAVGMSRYFTARQAGVKIDKLIRIWRDSTISTQDIASIDSDKYKIMQTMDGIDDDGLEITELSLERTVDKFDM